MYTDAELEALLRHPDAFVRSDADWAREYLGKGWRGLERNISAANGAQYRIYARLKRLEALGLNSSNKYAI